MYSVRGLISLIGTTVECCHSEGVIFIEVALIVRAGDSCHAVICATQTIGSGVESETINHMAAGSFHPFHTETFIMIIADINNVRGWGRSWREKIHGTCKFKSK